MKRSPDIHRHLVLFKDTFIISKIKYEYHQLILRTAHFRYLYCSISVNNKRTAGHCPCVQTLQGWSAWNFKLNVLLHCFQIRVKPRSSFVVITERKCLCDHCFLSCFLLLMLPSSPPPTSTACTDAAVSREVEASAAPP